MARATGVAWTRDQRLIALNLYCKLPFGKLHKGNPIIKEVALKMGRTPSSLALKLCNFASLDPVLHAWGIVGRVEPLVRISLFGMSLPQRLRVYSDSGSNSVRPNATSASIYRVG